MRILITGATGFVGREAALALFRDGHELVIVTRDPEKAAAEFPFPAKFFAWDALSGKFPAEAWDGVEGVVHLAGEGIADKRWSEKRKRELRDSRVVGTRTLIESLHENARSFPKFFLSASAVGVYGTEAGAAELAEDAKPGKDFLARLVLDWEAEARKARAKRIVILRFGMVVGRGGGALAKLLPIFRAGLGGRLGTGRQWMSWIHVADAARLIARAASDERFTGTFNAVAPEPVMNKMFTRDVADAVGRSAIFPVPRFALKLAMGEMACVALSSQRVIPRLAERLGFEFEYRELSRALREIVGDDKRAQGLHAVQWVPQPPAEVFPFFADEKNLELLTPAWLGFHILGKSTAEIEEGTNIRYRIRIRGIPLRWESRILEWKPNERFMDVQVKGPYAKWEHTHEFEPLGGGTLLWDKVSYRVPFGRIGGALLGPFVDNDVKNIFRYRRARIRDLFHSS